MTNEQIIQKARSEYGEDVRGAVMIKTDETIQEMAVVNFDDPGAPYVEEVRVDPDYYLLCEFTENAFGV